MPSPHGRPLIPLTFCFVTFLPADKGYADYLWFWFHIDQKHHRGREAQNRIWPDCDFVTFSTVVAYLCGRGLWAFENIAQNVFLSDQSQFDLTKKKKTTVGAPVIKWALGCFWWCVQ
jgi:hypothetical protein